MTCAYFVFKKICVICEICGTFLKNKPYRRSQQPFQVEIFVKKRCLAYKLTNLTKNTDNFT